MHTDYIFTISRPIALLVSLLMIIYGIYTIRTRSFRFPEGGTISGREAIICGAFCIISGIAVAIFAGLAYL